MDHKTGFHIKKIRELSSINLETLAEIVRITPEHLSKIEKQEFEPPVSVLLKIANALNTDIAALIAGKEFTAKGVLITKAASRERVCRNKNFHYESLAPFYSGKHIEPLIVTIQRSESDGVEFSQHKGEEFHFVLSGTFKIILGKEEHILEQGDTIYFDSSINHGLCAISDSVTLISTIYNGESMLQLIRSKYMRDIIQAAKLIGGVNIGVVCPDQVAMDAVNKGIEERVIAKAYLIGDRGSIRPELLPFDNHYEFIHCDHSTENYETVASIKGVDLVREKACQMLMKGHLNTAIFTKAVLNKERGITSGKRLSMVSMFELPNINRLIFLTDPGINTELVVNKDLQSSIDIIKNAIDVAKGLGIARPKVALLEANEMPSEKIPTTMFEKQLSEMTWEDADVYGPLSYDLALYEESAVNKGFSGHIVAGKADVMVVPFLSAGNFLYKAWAMTMNAEVASVVTGAQVPLIVTSRNDSDMTKFLAICASTVYSQYLRNRH
ncbi:MAG: cupin domain-containing protein [Chitinivibrionales bacterium]|nr:cupin domain-containing protein [Chitinivibrionales bacterium]